MDPLIERNKNKNKINVEILFGNLDQIINLGKTLLESLENNENVFLVFSKMIPFMKLYVIYVKNYENAVSLYSEKLKKDKEFLQLVKQGKLNLKSKGLELAGLLSKPFQRIFSYKNIFDRLLELTPKCSFEFENVEKLVKETENLVIFINEEKRQFENIQKITDLQKRISLSEGGNYSSGSGGGGGSGSGLNGIGSSGGNGGSGGCNGNNLNGNEGNNKY